MTTNRMGKCLTPADLREVQEGIFYTTEPLVVVDGVVIEFLKSHARSTGSRKARLCAHPSPEANQHDMLIVHLRDAYVAPHRHKNKSETFLILEGFANALMFDFQGAHTDSIPMGPAGSGRSFFYRMPPAQYHSLHIESDVLVFVESTKGPFRAEDSENAPWAPPPADVAAGRAFISGLLAD